MENTKAERLLEKVQEAQTAYWDALSELESELGCDIESTTDLGGYTVTDLIENFAEEN